MSGVAREFAVLAGIPREQLWGLIEEGAGPVWGGPHEYPWQRGHRTIEAVFGALRLAAAGSRAGTPSGTAPRFLSPLVREHLIRMSQTWQQNGPFSEIRLLELLGLVEVDHDDTYVLAVIGGLGDRWGDKERAAMLRADPPLLDLVWRFFEVEGGGEVSLANVDKFSVGTSWREVLGELVADGSLDRDRVLACCVEALGRDFSAYRAGWFSAFLESLDPSPAELAALQPRLRRLLGSTVTATAAVAVRSLKKVAAAGLLDDEECAELAPGLLGRTKGTPLEVLRLLRGVARRRPDLAPVVARTAATALEHQHPDVQRAAVTLLDALGAADLVAAAADLLAPTVRRQATGPAAEPDGDGLARDGDYPAVRDGVGDPGDRTPPGPAPAALRVPSGAGLVQVVAALLEDAEDPMTVEAALAGLAVTEDPGLLAPLARRAVTLMKRDGFADDHEVRAGVARLVLAATGTPGARRPAFPPGATDPAGLLRARLHHVEQVLTGRAPRGPLLATPADEDGWTDPRVLVARLATVPRPHPADLVGALLRLAPGGRPAALEAFAAQERTDETGDVVRHALGGPVPPAGPAAVRTAALWVAASRARLPQEDDPLLLAAGLGAGGQGRPVRAELELTPTGSPERFTVTFGNPPALRPPSMTLEPTRVPRARADLSVAHVGPDWARWVATIYPHDTEPAFSRLALHVLEALDYWEVDHTIPRALVALAHHPGRVGPLGAVTAAAGLAAQEGTHRMLAVDAVLALVTRGSLAPGDLAGAMRTIAPETRLPRWAPSLEQVAAAIGGGYVVEVLTELLAHLPRDARGLVKLLDVLAEESTRIARPVADPALRRYLESFTGGSGAAAAARRALAVG